MSRTIAIGKQDFADLITKDYFYIDKTKMIKEWWEHGDDVTLISRPRRFGKTLTMSMLDNFFSIAYKDRSYLFEKLSIWQEQEYRDLQGTYPVISLSFANTNYETMLMFEDMVHGWFKVVLSDYNDFVKALLMNDLDAMNEYMNRVALSTFSYFDTGNVVDEKSMPERFYHGFVLGLLVDMAKDYVVTSNRESGFGRYDVMLTPKNHMENAYILEFKVFNPKKENSMEQTVNAALEQIEDKKYDQIFVQEGISEKDIYKYGFAFEGKRVLIGDKN